MPGTETKYKVTEYSIEDCSFSFRVTAENAEGFKSPPLELGTPVRTERRHQLPEPPSYLRLKHKTPTSITLTWKSFSPDALAAADRFFVESRDKNGVEWSRIGHAYHEAFTCEGLDPSKAYYFRVVASNVAGESQATELAELVSMDISDEVCGFFICILVIKTRIESSVIVY